MIRQPVAAGRFYPGTAAALEREARGYLALAPDAAKPALPAAAKPTLLAMAPHAGYVYSGAVTGITLGQASLADTLLLLGPNHTGMGARLSLWNDGQWLTPLCPLDIDESFADALLAAEPRLTPDHAAHLEEHSLEVVIPFLCALKGNVRGVPIAVSERNVAALTAVAHSMAGVIKSWPDPVSLIVSSDMSHYVSRKRAKALDSQALEAITALDPLRLYNTVREQGITMCGVLPMTLGLMIALELGATKATVAAYATSGDASGDYDQVVGYAGVLVS